MLNEICLIGISRMFKELKRSFCFQNAFWFLSYECFLAFFHDSYNREINLYCEWIFKHFHLSSSTIAFSPHILFPWPLKILASLKFSKFFFEFFHSSKSHPLNELLVCSFWKSLRCYCMYVSTLGIMIFVIFVRWIIQFPPNSISIPCVTACLLNSLFFLNLPSLFQTPIC